MLIRLKKKEIEMLVDAELVKFENQSQISYLEVITNSVIEPSDFE